MPTIAKLPLSDTDLADALRNLVDSEDGEAELRQATQDNELHIERIESFEDAGLLTNAEGFVLSLSDGTRFEVKVTPRHANPFED